ncbi:hypothetical protein ACFWDA_23390 [Rhodococcus zopfii]|uniref:hypothetical protein n=1 Tax=Rhodococcus zopfii TaxID=43772 RepID=UPI0036539B21
MSGIPEPARPAPRRSRNTFEQAAQSMRTGDATPATPATPATQPAAVEPAPVAPRPAPVAQQPEPQKKRKAATTDILLSLSEDLKKRMVATLEHTRPRTGITSQQQFIRTAIDQLCKRLESEFNNGEAFPPPVENVNL